MGSKLFVGNLSYSTTEEALRAAFEEDGRTVNNVAIPLDRDTGRPRGFAFIEMGSDDDARAAVEAMDGQEIDGRRLRVDEARERAPRPGGFGGGGGGGGGGGYGGGRSGGGGGGRGGRGGSGGGGGGRGGRGRDDDYGDQW